MWMRLVPGSSSLMCPRQLDAVKAGHHQVRDDDVRPLAVHDGERLLTICGLTDDLHVGRWCEEEVDDLAILHRVIDDDDGQKNSPLPMRRDATDVPDAPAATVRVARA